MMAYLVNDKGELYAEQYQDAFRNSLEVLSWANGSALTSDGLVIYFYPYNLGSGADGEYVAEISYAELDGILKSTCCEYKTFEPISQILHECVRDSTRD